MILRSHLLTETPFCYSTAEPWKPLFRLPFMQLSKMTDTKANRHEPFAAGKPAHRRGETLSPVFCMR